MRAASPRRAGFRVAISPNDRHPLRSPAGRPLSPAFGLESLDHLGIDIDQDPRAFAKFLELKNRAQLGH
jgi:hypothetical protein